MNLYKIKDTLESKTSKEIKSIIDFMISACKINLTFEEIDEMKRCLLEYDLIKFFDDNNSINANIKRIYDFMNKSCPNYMKSLRNQEKCSINLRIQKQLLLKQKLYEVINHFSYQHWT